MVGEITGKNLLAIVFLLLFLIFQGHVLVEACFDPSDKYSVEVVLSKPGIVFNKSVLEELRGVAGIPDERRGNNVYIYRSHVDPKDFLVIISFQPLSLREGSDKYPTIRIEGKTILVEENVRTYRIIAKNINKTISVEEFKRIAGKQSWNVESVSLCPCGSSASLLLSKNYGGYVVEASATLSNTSQSASIFLTMRLEGKINDTMILSELETIVKETLGHNVSMDVSKTTSIEQFVEPAPGVNEELLKKALKTELEWLLGIGALKGLNSSDIDEIIGSIREGMAGWNERLVYYNGVWKPYSELVEIIPGAMLVKSSYGCSWSYPLDLLPDNPPQLGSGQVITPSTDTVINETTSGTTNMSKPPSITTTVDQQLEVSGTSNNEITSTIQVSTNKLPYLTIGLIILGLTALIIVLIYRKNHSF